MEWKKGCTNHPENPLPEDCYYHPVRGWICKKCGRKPTYLQATTVRN